MCDGGAVDGQFPAWFTSEQENGITSANNGVRFLKGDLWALKNAKALG
jgi:hypothetical protein